MRSLTRVTPCGLNTTIAWRTSFENEINYTSIIGLRLSDVQQYDLDFGAVRT